VWLRHHLGVVATRTTTDMPQIDRAELRSQQLRAESGSAADALDGARRLKLSGGDAITASTNNGTSITAQVQAVGEKPYDSPNAALSAAHDMANGWGTAVYSRGGHHVPLVLNSDLPTQQTFVAAITTTVNNIQTTIVPAHYEPHEFVQFAGADPHISAAATGAGDTMNYLGTSAEVAERNAVSMVRNSKWQRPALAALGVALVAGAAWMGYKAITTPPVDEFGDPLPPEPGY
jgi:hypothetical protein